MPMLKKRPPILKILIVAALLFSAGYIAFCVPEAAESFLPFSRTVRAERYTYAPTVTARGTIIKSGERWLAVVAVNEGDIPLVEAGQPARLSGAALPDGEFSGSVSAVGDTAYTSTLSAVSVPMTVVDVTVNIEEGDETLLRSGYSVTAQLRTGEERTVNMLPYSVIAQDEAGEYVYVLEDGVAVRHNIVTGIELSDRTEIIAGVTAEDVVLTNPENLFEGARVRTNSVQLTVDSKQ